MGAEELIELVVEEAVEAGGLAGGVTQVWRDGALVHASAVGWLNREAGRPMRPDALFRIASMTKPITSVVALQLWEEGRFALDEPITRWASELAELRVACTPAAPSETVPAERPITFLDLLTHRAGFTYGAFHPGPLGDAYAEALGAEIDSLKSPDAWIAALATLPLIDQPGHTLHYGHATDLLGLLLARMEDAPLADVFEARVFAPLGMADTGFTVSPDHKDRCATPYGFDKNGAIVPLTVAPGGATLAERPADLTFCSGGQGLWSTAADMIRFSKIFLGDGEVDGERLLQPATIQRMCTNVLTPYQRQTGEVDGMHLFERGHGFGLGVAVVMEPDHAAAQVCRGSVGTVGWPGAYGGWWQADRATRTAAVFLTHSMVERDQLSAGIGLDVFGVVEAVSELL